MKTSILALTLGAMVALIGCGSDSNSGTAGSGGAGGTGGMGGGGGGGAGGTEPSFQELYDQGLTKYVGEFDPLPAAKQDGEVTTYSFAVPETPLEEPRGPLCLRGTEYTVDVREGSSDALVIYLQGGGACWDTFCSAFEVTNSLPPSGILNPELEGNPVADWDVLYLPYCDGALFAGDVDRVLPNSVVGDGEPGESQAYQRGLQNLTAALDIGIEAFPNPSRILLTGISGGGFGTIAALPLVRYYYPETEILVVNDSGVGVAKEDDPDFVNETLIAGWNADSLVPESCPECTSNGHITRLIEWQLEADESFTMSVLSFSADSVIATFFLMLIPPDPFTEALLSETGRTAGLYDTRYKRFIADGTGHTFLLTEMAEPDGGGLDLQVQGVSVLDFFTAHIDGTEDWQNLVDEGLE